VKYLLSDQPIFLVEPTNTLDLLGEITPMNQTCISDQASCLLAFLVSFLPSAAAPFETVFETF